MGDDQVDWNHLQWRFSQLDAQITPIRVPSTELLEGHRLPELTYGQVVSPLSDLIEHGHVLHFTDELTREAVDAMMQATGFLPRSDGGLERIRTPSDIVREGLASRRMTQEFVEAWGHLSFYAGMTTGLLLCDQASRGDFSRKLNSGKKTTIVHAHWYAHWMGRNAPSLEITARRDEEVALTVLCGDIINGEVAPWKPYPRKWFRALLNRGCDDLSGSLTRLTKRQLRKMVKHPLLNPSVLPPLHSDEFRCIENSKP